MHKSHTQFLVPRCPPMHGIGPHGPLLAQGGHSMHAAAEARPTMELRPLSTVPTSSAVNSANSCQPGWVGGWVGGVGVSQVALSDEL